MNNTRANVFPGNMTCPEIPVDNLVSYMPYSTPLREEEIRLITSEIPVKTVKKGTFLLREGQIASNCYYIFSGCVREYYLMDGEERTTEFYTGGDCVSDDVSKLQRVPSKQYWECLEDTTLSILGYDKELELYSRFPRLESICRIETEKKFGHYREMMAIYLASTPEERYLNLLKSRPYLLERVPQYQLASYIGVKPESLSRIRSRIRTFSL